MAAQRHTIADTATSISAPAPWTLKGDMFWLILTLKSPLPDNIYDPLTAGTLNQQTNDFQGGLGMVQAIQYHDSPLGPYNELLVIPGNFKVPAGEAKGKSKLRISRIYVDSEASCYHGRKNWNIPKHMARFEWSTSQSGERSIAVYSSDAADHGNEVPFFSANLMPMSWCPIFPISTRYLPLGTTIVQPPLPAGGATHLPGTESWKLCHTLVTTKRAKLIWAKVDPPELQGPHWPQVQSWSIGVFLEKGELTIEKPEEFSV